MHHGRCTYRPSGMAAACEPAAAALDAVASAMMAQALLQLRHGQAAVADAVLALCGQFGSAGLFGCNPEQRVVAEAVVALRRVQNAAAPDALADDGGRVAGVAHGRDATMKRRAALRLGHV